MRPQLTGGGGGGEQQLQIYNSILQDRLSHFSLRASCFVEFQDVVHAHVCTINNKKKKKKNETKVAYNGNNENNKCHFNTSTTSDTLQQIPS